MNKKASEPESTPELKTYFFPTLGVSVEAGSQEEAEKKARKLAQETGDGE